MLGDAPARGKERVEQRNSWMSRYPRRLALIDAIVVMWATSGALIVRFGITDDLQAEPIATYAVFTVILSLVWWCMLGAWDSRSPRVLGSGAEEYKRVFAASMWLFGLIAIFSYSFRYDTARGYVGLALPAGVVGLLIARWLVRQLLNGERLRGMSVSRILIIGGSVAVDHLASSFRKTPFAGYAPTAAYVTDGNTSRLQTNSDLPIVGSARDVDCILEAIDACAADSVAISAGAHLEPPLLRRLGWALSARGTRLILAPALTDVAGPRIHTQPVAGLPLVHVSTPRLTGGSRILKRMFDICGSALLLVLLSPLLCVVAILVKLSSPGPIFYAQERIGVGGATFRMFKFRSMVVDADERLHALLKKQGTS